MKNRTKHLGVRGAYPIKVVKTCSVTGCAEAALSKGMCKSHAHQEWCKRRKAQTHEQVA